MHRISLNDKGATLIELLLSSIILIVVIASFYQLILAFYQHYQNQEEIAEVQQQARVAADLISREIQMTGYDPKGALFLPDHRPNEEKRTKPMSRVRCERRTHAAERILEATPVVFHFLADLNGNAVLDDSIVPEKDIDEDVRYEWVGESGIDSCGTRKPPFSLYRDTGGGGGGQEVALFIDYFKLVYFDEEDRAFPERSLTQEERARIRKVIVTLRARSERRDPQHPSEPGYRTRQVVLEARLRNM
jgi:Tfp pilus assembly protein PilE